MTGTATTPSDEGAPSCLPLARIVTDPARQPRSHNTPLNTQPGNVSRMVQALEAGITLPPVLCLQIGPDPVLVDGHHRLHAHRLAGRKDIMARIVHDPSEAAVLASALNANGLPWTRMDAKKAAVAAMVAGDFIRDGVPWSFTEVAKVYAMHGLNRDPLIRYADKVAETDERVAAAVARIRQHHCGGEGSEVDVQPVGEASRREFLDTARRRRIDSAVAQAKALDAVLRLIPKHDRAPVTQILFKRLL